MHRKFLGDAGFRVEVVPEARSAYSLAQTQRPDCIICDEELPDIDGFWVVRRLRNDRTGIENVPLVFLSPTRDLEARLQGMHIGVDVFMTKPVSGEEILAQVSALLDMANRLRRRRDSYTNDGGPTSGTAALRGDVSQVSIATVLSLLELERRSGQLRVRLDDSHAAMFDIGEGFVLGAELDGKPNSAIETLGQVLRWKSGRFSFTPGTPQVKGVKVQESIGSLLLEAMRLEDEATR